MSPILVVTCGYNPTCGGTRVMNYLAALLHACGYAVWVSDTCHYNPTIPVSKTPDPNTITIYPDGVRGNPYGAKKICRYMLYYARGYFGDDRIAKDESCVVFHRDYFQDVSDHCDHSLTEDDIITLPYLESMFCFPEPKTVKAVFYQGKGIAAPQIEAERIPAPQGCLYTSRNRTLSMLRRAENFYTTDKNTIMCLEAHLCGCKVWMVDGDKVEKADGFVSLSGQMLMNPVRDIETARHFAEHVSKFFGEQP